MKRCFIVVIALVLLSCNSLKKNAIVPLPISKTDWTLETMPNNLDVVGVIFGIDKKGTLLRIPGGKLNIQTVNSPVVLTENRQTKKVSYGALINFLNLNRYIDSTTRIDASDSTKIETTFSLQSGVLTNINDDLASAFEKQKKAIERNSTFLDLDSTKLFLILETIQAPRVDITFNKTKSFQISAVSKIQKLFNFNTSIAKDKENDNHLSYDLKDSLVVFYKLRSINLSTHYVKGSSEKVIELSLGESVNSDEMHINTF